VTAEKGLPSEGREREIFIRALRKFSDECETPNLQPDCPFAVPLSNGTRGCGEECMDILGQYGDDRSAFGIDLGNGLVAKARPQSRPRRGPGADAQPFDAREIMLRDRDSGRTVSTWNTVSLVSVLQEELTSTPLGAGPERERIIRECWAELERRGYRVDALVRQGMAKRITTTVAIAAVVPGPVELRSDNMQLPGALRPAPPEWRELLERTIDSDSIPVDDLSAESPDDRKMISHLTSALSGRFMRVARAWVRTANLDDFIAWQPPGNLDETLLLADLDSAETRDDKIQEWLVDRFANTYLNAWATDSLHLEWRYVHAEIPPPCPSKEMAARRIGEVDLAREITSRAVRARARAQKDHSVKRITSLSINEMKKAAVEFLDAGRRAEAAGLFEAAKRVNPQDPEVVNDHGFCVLPDRPEEGVREIERASDLGYPYRDVTVANRMYGLLRMGRLASALDAADRFLAEEKSGSPAFLWDWRRAPDDPVTVRTDTRLYITQLGLHIAELTDDETLVKLWTERAEATD
jgi:hypothetical protein